MNQNSDGGDTTVPSPAVNEVLYDQQDLLVTLSSVGDAVITTDGEERVSFLNPVAQSLTGWELQDAVGQPLDGVFRIIDEESRQVLESPSAGAFRERRTVVMPNRSLLIAKDGTERPLEEGAASICTLQGEFAGVVLVFREITELRRTERKLAKALAYADDIIATLREPFLVLDSELRVKSANRSFYDSFHVSNTETEDQFVYKLGNGQWDIPALRTLLDRVLVRNESVDDYEVEHSFPSLGRKTMLLNARPFPPDSKHPELILLAVEDVTALRARADELADANQRKDHFLATLAHELRNPLSPICTAVYYLGKEGLKEADMKSACGVIARQVAVMVRLIDDLIDVSRITRNNLDIRKECVELSTVVDCAVESSRPLIEQCGHELTVRLSQPRLRLIADPVRLAQVFSNLLNNAAKYTRRGGRILLAANQDGNDIVVRVQDNGIGIDHGMLASIFEMFTQVDRSVEQSHGGLGVGLALVRRLVEMHEGSIEARSNGPNEGSEFVVRLPLMPTPDEVPPEN